MRKRELMLLLLLMMMVLMMMMMLRGEVRHVGRWRGHKHARGAAWVQ